jgi:ketosteroid isomerase-like protein
VLSFGKPHQRVADPVASTLAAPRQAEARLRSVVAVPTSTPDLPAADAQPTGVGSGSGGSFEDAPTTWVMKFREGRVAHVQIFSDERHVTSALVGENA